MTKAKISKIFTAQNWEVTKFDSQTADMHTWLKGLHQNQPKMSFSAKNIKPLTNCKCLLFMAAVNDIYFVRIFLIKLNVNINNFYNNKVFICYNGHRSLYYKKVPYLDL